MAFKISPKLALANMEFFEIANVEFLETTIRHPFGGLCLTKLGDKRVKLSELNTAVEPNSKYCESWSLTARSVPRYFK